MTCAFHGLIKRLLGAAVAICIGLCLILAPLGISAEASGALMSGNYMEDTVSVAHSLQEIITIPTEGEGQPEAKTEAVQLITAYISRYRNRYQVNTSLSYTTMQTALNAMAGHYKTFPNRALPDQLKERLDNQLSKAAELAAKES